MFKQEGGVLKAGFTKIDIESSVNCTKDYVMIQDGVEDTSPVLGKFCGRDLPKNFSTTGYEMLVTFVSDEQNNFGGFEMHYERFIPGKFIKCFLMYLATFSLYVDCVFLLCFTTKNQACILIENLFNNDRFDAIFPTFSFGKYFPHSVTDLYCIHFQGVMYQR